VRQYAHERLALSGELEAIRRLHANWWETDANVGGPRREDARGALEQELDNLRAALRWSLDLGEAPTGLRLARAHWNVWVVEGALAEGRAWLTPRQPRVRHLSSAVTELRAMRMQPALDRAVRSKLLSHPVISSHRA
jgi:hypothetical protein